MIADIHIHCSTKPMLMHGDPDLFEAKEFHVFLGLDEFIGGDIVDSQSSLDQQIDGEVGFSINPLYTLERNIACMGNVQLLADDPQVDENIINGLASGDRAGYTHTSIEYQEMQANVANKPDIHLIDGQSTSLSADKLNLLVSIEGLHGLMTTAAERRGQLDQLFYDRLRNACQIMRPAYITLVHMQQNYLFSFCSGIKMSNKKQRGWFLPFDRGFQGLNDDGRRIIDLLCEEGVSIDVKHTSMANRLAIYAYMEEQGLPSPIASHVGLTYMEMAGFLSHHRENEIRSVTIDPQTDCGATDDHPAQARCLEYTLSRQKGPLTLRGNAAQINLFDEDLHYLLRRKGLIGLSLDQRILGATFAKNATRKQTDHLSVEDAKYLKEKYNLLIGQLGYPGQPLTPAQMLQPNGESATPGLLQDLFQTIRPANQHINYLAQTIMYIIMKGYEWGLDEPWRCISIGSDFDGMINAIDGCTSADCLPDLKKKLIKCLEDHRRTVTFRQQLKDRDGVNVETVVDAIFWDNAVRFFANRMQLDAHALLADSN